MMFKKTFTSQTKYEDKGWKTDDFFSGNRSLERTSKLFQGT